MSSSDEKKATFGNPIVNLVLTGLVFLFFTWILRAFVPATTGATNLIFSAFAALALTVTFYFSLNMFRVTFSDYKHKKNQ